MAFPSAPYDDDDFRKDGLLASERAGDNAPALSISEISAQLKRTVEDRFGFVRVRGELSGVKRAASGHLYMALKDEGARLDGVMWRGNAQRLGFLPEDGVEVIATGKLTTYPGRSNYQIVVDRMEIAGEGALLALLAKTKARLEAEGLFDRARKRALPFLPRVIGVVTSPTGAVIRDILHRLSDRFPSHVVVWPVLVQGQGAAAQVAAAVRGFSDLAPGGPVPRPDVVIVARGGGSIEDLWSFNEEEVVRAIAASTIPVISAVGHETDTTLADFAADLRAPTPTAAAELVVPVRAELAAQVHDLQARRGRALARLLAHARERLEVRSQRLPTAQALLSPQSQRLDDLSDRLRRALVHRTEIAAGVLARHGGALRPALLTQRLGRERERLAAQRLRPEALLQRIEHARGRVEALDRLRRSLDPEAPLQRGYVLVTDRDGHVVKDRATAAARVALTLKFADGPLDVTTGQGPVPTVSAAPPRPAARPRGATDSVQPKLL
ncbi:exodeoxyribonuclease VII large subunit [Novosphingobium pokkalii]|uniref:Exodeoxyribonuclease 7 large subunit n=1 Tax=Novosphingobium pokkalii TaxID=1770194 RepID=A0ABV7V233_9SPHN|nr:exodeoxyribonuclease VII large subunit [Novosphingobium pokkalii]GHC85320.1 exodeoxyribonuclease 7 large subunit [Novosphingobium pokkalii]